MRYDNTNSIHNIKGGVRLLGTMLALLLASGTVVAQTIGGSVYGGGNEAKVTGNVKVEIEVGMVTGSVYGGGKAANVEGVDTVYVTGGTISSVYGGGLGETTRMMGNVAVIIGEENANSGASISGDVYGGSAKGKTNCTDDATPSYYNNSKTDVILNAGTITGSLYGGGHGLDNASADVYGPVIVEVNGGSASNVFGCNNLKGAPQNTVQVDINNNVNGNVFGGGNLATYTAPGTTPGNYPVVNVKNGTVTNVFGGGLGSTAVVSGNPQVTIGDDVSTHVAVVSGNVYGGGDQAHVLGSTNVTYNDNSTTSSVAKLFGGGNNIANNNGVSGTANVTLTSGKVTGGVYGGCNDNGRIGGNITVNVNGGTIGTDTDHRADVYGGGYGENTTTSGDVTVSFGVNSDTHNEFPKLYGDVYGGSALGSVNTPNGSNTTIVNINNGTLVAKTETENNFPAYRGGNVFGGGLGQTGTANVSKGQVNGAVTVNIGSGTLASTNPDVSEVTNIHGKASIGGNVYGCNNTNGSPKKSVLVNVFQTEHTANDSAVYINPDNEPNVLKYAIHNVFGGGNKADFTGTGAAVKIYTCDNTIDRVFGGGNAAATNSITTMIQGGRFAEVYCGGNGEVSPANVNGTAALNIHGGNIGETFGGSNQQGTISGGATVNVDDDGPCDAVVVEEFFCGGKYADYVGNINATITCNQNMQVKNLYGGCKEADVVDWPEGHANHGQGGNVNLTVYGGTFENVYGGSKGYIDANNPANNVSADIEGNVRLDIYGGTIDNVFGGSNVLGNIAGKIIVNILDLDGGNCDFAIHNVYGGGRDAAYTPTTPGDYPEVNIIHGAITEGTKIVNNQNVPFGGNVFGGGLGAPAVVTSNPKVNIGYIADMDDYLPTSLPSNPTNPYSVPTNRVVTVANNVFGGGDEAAVAGATSVSMNPNSSALSLFGGGNQASVGGAIVNVFDGSVSTGVYGGCNESGTVSGDIAVNIKSNLGNGTTRLAEGIYGGGKGNLTRTTGDVTVTIDKLNSGATAPVLYSDVYGGSAFGQVGAGDKLAKVDLKAGTINGTIYGGGKGSDNYSATVSGNTELAINGNVTKGVYGGCNVKGNVLGNSTVGITGGTIGHETDYGAVYGGGLGENTKVLGNVVVNVNGANAAVNGDVYGGSAQGLVNCNENGNGVNGSAYTQVTLTNGTITGNLYGGGHGLDSKAANVWGPVTVNVNGGSVANVFGCNNAAGAPQNTVQVNVEKSNESGAPALTISQSVYGGGNQAAYTYTCAQNQFSPEVNIKNGAITSNVFGGGLGAPAKVCSNPKVTFGSTTTGYSASAVNVYGGGSAAEVGKSTTSAINNAEVLVQTNASASKVFGGGMAAGVTGTTAVTVSGGAVTSGVYGGCDSEGAVGSTATVQINGGTIGTENNTNGVVYGGGLGENTVVNGSVAVNIGSAVGATPNATIHGDVYGGSAMGLVNCMVNGTTQTPVNSATTGVTLNAGTINGDLYGGGHGLQSKAANVWGDVTVTVNGGSINTFTVGSNTYGGQVFGCNNLNGTPKKDVAVHIYGTNHGDTPQTNLYPTLGTGQTWNATTLAENTDLPQAFAIAAVYGGGNKAAFIPMVAGTGEDPHSATVHVYGCFNTIEDIFGGGNAADVGSTGTGAVTANTNVIIEGGRIKHVFGGGNGAGTGNPGANIYGTATTTLYAGVINQVFGGSNERGDITEANLNLDHDENNTCDVFYGEVFGGGNMALINGSLVTNVFCGAGSFGDFYGGANEADITGDVTLNVFGGTFNNVFGGSKGKTPQSGATAAQVAAASADIGGNVTLNLYGGTINQAAYGGSDVFGNIGGMITVNVLDLNKSCGALSVSNVYGGGRNAFYTPTYTPTDAERVSPMVNLIHGTITNVFGGAYGSGAAVNASPRINIGYDANTMSGLIPTNLPTGYTLPASFVATVTNNVYGGGDLAEVAGNTTVNHNAGSVASLFGGGNKASVGGATVYVFGGSVSTGVYGGCNESGYVGGNITTYSIPSGSTVTPAIVSTLGTIEVNVQGNLGSSGAALTEGVFGGGKGGYVDNNNPGTHTSGTVTVNIGNGTNAPVLYSDVYGGSAFGQVAAGDKLTKVNFMSGTINGTLYGGGKGQLASTNPVATAFEAEVTGNTQVLVNGNVTGGVYGGCNVNGIVKGGSTVGITAGTIDQVGDYGAVYGGGLGANTKVKGNVAVTINKTGETATTINGDVYGGSAQGLVNCNEAGDGANAGAKTDVTLTLGTVNGSLYGGGHGLGNAEAHVWGPVVVTLNNGTANNVFGGNNLKGSPQNTVQVDVKGGTIINNVYGGGNQADYTGGSPIVNIQGGTVHQNVFGGGNEAGVGLAAGTSTTQVNVSSGTVGDAATDTYGIYGGCNTSGTVKGHVKVNITGGTLGSNVSGSSYRLKGIYGGGLGKNTVVNGNVAVAIGADVYGDVYGGSAKGLVNCTYNTTTSAYEHTANDTTGVTLNSGAVTGDIYGGGHGLDSEDAHVYGPVTVAIKAGSVNNVFGCNNLKGAPQNGTLVNINGGTVSQDVYGGGNLANASTTATHVIVNGGTISRDVYGGGAFAHTGATMVDILNGTITRNIYGGALGGSGYTPEVNGTVTVNIGTGTMAAAPSIFTASTTGNATIGGSVYGCNNAAGSPKDNVTVNVYQTAHTDGTGGTPNNTVNGNAFAIANVFGGGNMANFMVQGKTATVNIYGCDNTIGRTFGGGDAASTNTVNTMIQGGHIGTVFGGGNGESGTAANVNGDVNLGIHGGHVGQFFGGSNRTGTITGDINLVVDDISPCPDHLEIDEFFCGGNFADVIGGLSTDIACSDGMKVNNLYGGCNMANIWGDVVLNLYGGEYKNVFGGSKGDLEILTTQGDSHINKAADIKKYPNSNYNWTTNTEHYPEALHTFMNSHAALAGTAGNVTLNLYGGKVTENVFGGSNVNGNIEGVITVNVLDYESTQCPLNIQNIYGSGNLTAYTPNDVDTDVKPTSPIINVMHVKDGSSIGGSVFGGAKGGMIGETELLATVTSNPKVNIGYDSETMTIPTGYTGPAATSFKANITGSIYGGGDLAPVVGSTTVILRENAATTAVTSVGGNVFGGGNLANVSGSTTVDVSGGTVTHDVYGGGALANTGGSNVTLDGGTVTQDIYGGGLGDSSHPAAVSGDVLVTVNSGVVRDVYGCNNVNGAPTEDVQVDINGAVGHNVYGGGNQALSTVAPIVNINTGANVTGSVFGGGNQAGVGGGNVNMLGGLVRTGLYGGCNTSGTVTGDIAVALNGGTVGVSGSTTNVVFGGGYGHSTATNGDVGVTLNGTNIYGNLYGGSALGSVNEADKTTTVTLTSATLHGKVFGGGMGSSSGDDTKATTLGAAIVNINAANTDGSLTGIYGGANVNGNVAGAINVNVNANVGALGTTRDVFGGGLGEYTSTSGNVTVNVGDLAGTYQPVIYGDIYGGSALGSVNDAAADKTTVNFLNGTLHGNVYGGGLGQSGNENVNKGKVIGEVIVNVSNNTQSTENCHIDLTDAKVYGCNNTNGSPQDNVTVNIYKTAHTTGTSGNGVDGTGYAITKVFGGGNLAPYNPTGTQTASVIIYGCENTIQDVFGGGDAAAVKKASVLVNGGRFDRVFAGGNGENGTADIGAGGTSLEVKAGKIRQLFGGSNMNGTISGPITVNLNHDNIDCPEDITEFFGGSNLAAIGTDANPATLVTTIACGVGNITDVYGGSNAADIIGNVTLNIEGGTITNAYGGSKGVTNGTAANIKDTRNNGQPIGTHGKVTLNLKGGTVTNAYGGSNLNGNIEGEIAVNVSDQGSQTCPLKVTDIYGASNLAAYTPNTGRSTNSPAVYVKNVKSHASATNPANTVLGNVYGGGKGSSAIVTSNPLVVVGDSTSTSGNLASVDYHVYGGGNAAAVNGNTKVLMQKGNSKVSKLFGGGAKAGVSGSSITLSDGLVADGVFGGCDTTGMVTNNTEIFLNGGNVGTVDHPANYDICGGGWGQPTRVGGNVAVTFNGTTAYCDVYGGSYYGDVNTNNSNTTTITLNSGNVIGNVYGGAFGDRETNVDAKVNGAVTVNIHDGTTVNGDVFGCNNDFGAPQSTVNVTMDGGTVRSVMGGGNLADYGGTPVISISGGHVLNQVVGGGNAAHVAGSSITISGGNIATSNAENRGVYGGCNASHDVTGNAIVSITGGTIGNNTNASNVFGGGYGKDTRVGNNVEVTVNGTSATIWGDVYGGSALGNVNGNSPDANKHTYVTLTNGTVKGNVYGGGLGHNDTDPELQAAAKVNGAVAVSINGGKVEGDVYGCNNEYGAPHSTVKVDVYSSTGSIANVFGGGNLAGYSGTPEVTIHNCDNTIGYVYGGGNKAGVNGTKVKVYGGDIDYVFGGGNGQGVAANFQMVNGNAVANIYGGTIDHVFGGNNSNGAISGTVTVNVDKQTESGHNSCDMYIGEVYGGGNLAAGNAGTITIGCTGSLVSGANGHIAHPENIGTTLEGVGTVYGGANQAGIGNDIQLDINNGIVNKVFGGNNTSGTISGTIQVNINKTGNCDWYVGEVYGGGNHADYNGTPDVNIINGTVSGNVYGGGNDITDGTKGVVGSDVEMTGGQVLGGVYGGCNLKGTVTGNSLVKIYGGTVGSQDQLEATPRVVAQVFGGGLGANTKVNGNVTVNVNKGDGVATAPIIWGDVYGGSALGSVNTNNENTTTVNILDGTLGTKTTTGTTPNGQTYYNYFGGNVFGGGLGDDTDATKGQVKGKVFVNIGTTPSGRSRDLDPVNDTCIGNATIKGNVYGCNNTNGSPLDDVTVNIYRTHRDATDEINYIPESGDPEPTFAIANVFGGGNRANYTASGKTASVNIFSCYNSIQRVFGGGNAAAAPNVHTNIQGGRFAEVFGGGNGEVSAANITGNVNLEIHGGTVGEFYVGSNQNGSISGTSNVTVDQSSGCEEVNITEFYCGGKYADFVGDINATITCSQDMHVTNLYGGCKEAHVKAGNGGSGNIHLTVVGGTFENVYGGSRGTQTKGADIEGNITLDIFGGTITKAIYGGSNVKGAIGGTITVNVEDKYPNDNCSLEVSTADVYGGGNQADYPGIPDPTGPLYNLPNHAITHTSPYNYPEVNIKNASVKNVFGGGLNATVTGNPQIFIKKGSKVLGNVYGGGNMGEVNGNPRVIVNGKQTN